MFQRLTNWMRSLFGYPPRREETRAPVAAFPPTPPSPPPAGAGNAQAPLIGISGGKADTKSVTAMMAMVRAQGGTPVLLCDHANRHALQDLDKLNGLIVMGNDGDIDPALYGEAKHDKTNIEKDKARADYEFAIIREAIARKVPLLGVCGGMQRISVVQKGKLIQHVPDLLGGDEYHVQGDTPMFIPVQCVKLVEGTQLAAIGQGIRSVYTPRRAPLPPGVVMENSCHHQSVMEACLGEGLRVAARSMEGEGKPGIVEAIEPDPNGPLRNHPILGVQWHPEFGASELAPKIVSHIVGQAKHYALNHPRNVDAIAPYVETLASALPVMENTYRKTPPPMLAPEKSYLEYIANQRAAAAGAGRGSSTPTQSGMGR